MPLQRVAQVGPQCRHKTTVHVGVGCMSNEFNAAHESDKRAVASAVPLLRFNGVGKTYVERILMDVSISISAR